MSQIDSVCIQLAGAVGGMREAASTVETVGAIEAA